MTHVNDWILSQARILSRKLAYKWGQDQEDISQELILWCLKQGITGDYESIEDEEEREALRRQARASMRWEGERYCRRLKAAQSGYTPEDEAFYSLKALQELLVVYYQVGIVERSPITAGDSVRHSKGDGAEYGSYLASMIDISTALARIPHEYRQRLDVRFGPLGHLSDGKISTLSQSEIRDLTGWHHDTLLRVLGDTTDKIRHRTDTALRKLQNELGGPNPWNRGPNVALVA